jgi:vitamin B12/bleomycin/antimicrobial peptide transport system ATP-binding/permease protein
MRDVGDLNDGGATRTTVATRAHDSLRTQLGSLLAALAGIAVSAPDGVAGSSTRRGSRSPPGERVLIVVEHGSDKSAPFRAMAGLWPWGAGTIYMPRRDPVMFMPQRPYLPLGTLRAGASYPAAAEAFGHASLAAALERVGLWHLLPALDREERWDQRLALEEQQRLAFARLLLHRPRWVLLDDAPGTLGEEHRHVMLSVFERELADTAVVSIARSPAPNGFYHRTRHLRRLEESATLVPVRPRPRSAQPRALRASGGSIRASA